MLEIVLSIAGLLCLGVVLLGCLDCLYRKKRFQAFGIRDTTHAEHNAAFSVDIFDADSISEPVIMEPLPDILSKVLAVPVLRPRITCTERGKQEAALSLLSVQRSFPRDHLTYLNEIGSGWFGKVIKSDAVQIVAESYTSSVVVKMLKDDATKQDQKQFMEEVMAFRCLEHTNLITFLGQCTEATPYLVILEFSAHGNLKSYLVRQRQNVDTFTSMNRLVSFALDVASGLACLHRHDYIHCDLAARNCLVMSDLTVKIGDYGISDYLFKDEYFNTGTELLPVRWMAPETLSLIDGVWTLQRCNKASDMWSFGILLWEICSLGKRPYDNLSNESVLQNVVLDRVVLPSEVNTKLPFKVKMWSVMIQCWVEPPQRLNVECAHDLLEQLKTKLDDMAAISEFDQKWNHLEPNNGKKPSINLESRSPLVSNFVTDFPSAQEKPSQFYGDLDAPDGVSNADVVIDVDSKVIDSSRGLDDLPAPAMLIEHSKPVIDHNLSKIQQSDSSYVQCHVMVENELNRSSTAANHTIPAVSLDQLMVSTAGSVSHGSGSTSQFFSPHSSPSSEYMTMSDSFGACNQEETVKYMTSIDKDYSIDSEGISCDDLVEDTVMPAENNVVNKNNVLLQSFLLPQLENFSDYVHVPPTKTVKEVFSELKSATTNGSDSLYEDKYVFEDDRCNIDASLVRTDITSALNLPGKSSDSSEFAASADDACNVESDKKFYAKFSMPGSADNQETVNSASLKKFNSFASSGRHDAVTHYLVTADVHSEPHLHLESDVHSEKNVHSQPYVHSKHESIYLTNLSEPQSKSNTSSRNAVTNVLDDKTESPTLGSLINVDIPEEAYSESRKHTESLTSAPNVEVTVELNSDSGKTLFSSIDSPTLGTTVNMNLENKSKPNTENVTLGSKERVKESKKDIFLSENTDNEERVIEVIKDIIAPENIELDLETSSTNLAFNFSAIINSVSSANESLFLHSPELSSFRDSKEDLKSIELKPAHINPGNNDLEENQTKLVIHDSGNAFNSTEILDQSLSSDSSLFNSQTLSRAACEVDGSEDVVDTSNKNYSNSAESGMHSESITEGLANNSSTYSVDLLAPHNHMSGSDSSDMVIQDSDYVENTWPLDFKSNIYRCSSINLADDTQNDLKDDIHNETEDDIQNDPKDDIQNDPKDNIQNDLAGENQNEVEDNIQNEVEDNIQNEAEDDIQNEAEDDIQNDLAGENQIEAEDNIQNEAEDNIQNEAEAGPEESFKSNEDQEDSQSTMDSDTESSNSNSGSEQEYFLNGQSKSEQPLTSSPDLASANPGLAPYNNPDSPTHVDFDDYALQIASEIYLSRGVKSPRVYEIPPLETIPEHPPMPSIQEDYNFTPSDTSSVEVRYEEIFGSDNFEWDDFYGDPLIGKDTSLQSNANTSSFRGHDVADWSMDLDSESFVSNKSMASMKSEDISLNGSVQSEKLFTRANVSAGSPKSIFSSSDSELFSSTHSKSIDSSKETLVSSILSHLHSPGMSRSSNFGENNFYSLTERYDLETDSSSDGLASPLGTITSPSKSFSSVVYPIPYESPLTARIEPNSCPLPGSSLSDNYIVLEPSTTSNVSSVSEETEALSKKSSFSVTPVKHLLSNYTEIGTTRHTDIAPSKNAEDGKYLNSDSVKTIQFNCDQYISSFSHSTDSEKEDVIIKSQDTDSLEVLSSQEADSSFIDF